jgi:hypothetical protein
VQCSSFLLWGERYGQSLPNDGTTSTRNQVQFCEDMCNFGSAEFDLTKLAEFDGSSPVLM